jgi:hypothetical protein
MMAKKTSEYERNEAVARFHAGVTRLGLVLDTLEESARIAGKKITVHAETWKALHRHQANLRTIADNALKEVCDAHSELHGP